MRACSKQSIKCFLDGLSIRELEFLKSDWQIWARDDQLPPDEDCVVENDWTTWLILGGRGAGKTRAGAEWVRAKALGIAPLALIPSRRIALIGETIADVRSVMVEGVSGLLNIHRPHERPIFEPSKRQLTWPNGAIAQLFSAEDPESLRGPQFDLAWCDELAKWKRAEHCWDMLQFALRLGTSPKQVVTTTPRQVPIIQNLLQDPRTRTSRAKTEDNAAHLAPNFLNSIVSKYKDTRLGRQELNGEILYDRPDALWQREPIEAHRSQDIPVLERIVVAVDPPVTSGARSDACGIIVAGLGLCTGTQHKNDQQQVAFVLADYTVQQAKPTEWAKAVARAYHMYEADRIVVEVNQGGELVENVIRQIECGLPIKHVRASRGKWLRAEPVAALYEQGRVRHVGVLKQLEDQMCDFSRNGLSSGRSPDRLDALVWAITDLLLSSNRPPQMRRL